MSLFLSTPTHYLGIRLRNHLVPQNLHAFMVGHFTFDRGFTSLVPDREISPSVRLQLIHSHSFRIVLRYLGSDFPRTCQQFSSMTGNQVVSTMFDFSTCNRMARFVLSGDRIEDPGSHLFYPSYDGVCMICIDTQIHFVCHMAMSLVKSSHIDPQCIPNGYVAF